MTTKCKTCSGTGQISLAGGTNVVNGRTIDSPYGPSVMVCPDCRKGVDIEQRLDEWQDYVTEQKLTEVLRDAAKTIRTMRAALEFYASGSIAASEDGGKRANEALR